MTDNSSHERAAIKLMAPEDWPQVEVGDKVGIIRPGQPIHVGVVDARTADSQIIWLLSPDGSRKIFVAGDGYLCHLEHTDLTDTLFPRG